MIHSEFVSGSRNAHVEQFLLTWPLSQTGFNGDDGSYVILTWVGDGTGVSVIFHVCVYNSSSLKCSYT